jgi:uncharacterized protein YbjT (DUF2867 family)
MILLTGATGTTGSEVATALSAAGVPFKALVRNPDAAAPLQRPGVELVQGDLADPASVAAALNGVSRAFLLTAPTADQTTLQNDFITAAKSAGVRHIVKLSVAPGDGANRFARLHAQGDAHLKQSGLAWTLLQPTFFMQNLLGLAGMIRGGTIYQPAGAGRSGYVDVRDIAAVAAAALTGPGHDGQTYTLTGPEDLSFREIADRFSDVLGRLIVYVDIPPEAARDAMLKSGMPTWNVDGVLELMAALRADQLSFVTDDVRRVTGRRPRPLEQFIRDHETHFGAEVH